MTQRWFVRHTDDDSFMNMTVISSTDHGDRHDGKRFDDEPDTIAIVFHQLAPMVGYDSEDCHDQIARDIARLPEFMDALRDIVSALDDHTADSVEFDSAIEDARKLL